MEWLAARIAISRHSVCCRYVYRVKQTNEILHAQRMPGAFVISEICQSQDTDIISKLPILFNARLQEHTHTLPSQSNLSIRLYTACNPTVHSSLSSNFIRTFLFLLGFICVCHVIILEICRMIFSPALTNKIDEFKITLCSKILIQKNKQTKKKMDEKSNDKKNLKSIKYKI